MRFFRDELDITDGINDIILSSIRSSIDKNSKDTFLALVDFIRNVIQTSVQYESQVQFEKYIFFTAYFYSLSFNKSKDNPLLVDLHKFCSKQAASQLKSIILYDIGIERSKDVKIEKQIIKNHYYYLSFSAFSRLLYFMSNNSDVEQFMIAVNEFENISDYNYNLKYDLIWEIKRLERLNVNREYEGPIKEKKEYLSVLKAFDDYKRHTLVGIKFWILFLYRVNKIQEEIAIKLIDRIRIQVESEDFLNDIIFFRSSRSFSYFNWGSWDYKERPSGKTYSPPSPDDWLTFGFLFEQIRTSPLYVNINDINSDEISNIKYLYDSLKGYIEFLKSNFDKWKRLLKTDTIEDLNLKCENILKVFAELNKKRESDTYSDIANTKISPSHVAEFRQSIGKAWENQTRIHRLFKSKNNYEVIDDQGIELKIVGKSIFFEKGKMMFIDGVHSQTIIGVERFGGDIGRWEDDLFFISILKDNIHSIIENDAVSVIEKSILKLKELKLNPDIILIPSDYSYKEQSLITNSKFISKSIEGNQDEKIWFYYIGTFDEIPIYTSFSDLLNNRIIVANFCEAFKMRVRHNNQWYNNELKVDIKEIDDAYANKELEINPTKWKKTEEDLIFKYSPSLDNFTSKIS